MIKLVVLFAFLAAVNAAPGYLHGGIALPLATSHSSRIDIHSKPIVTYAAPAVVHAAPIIKTIVAAPAVIPSVVDVGYGHGFGGFGSGYGHGGGLHGYGHGGFGHGYGHYW